MSQVVFAVVDDGQRERRPVGPRLRIDWSPVIEALGSGATVEITLPPHPKLGLRDDNGRMVAALLRNTVNKELPQMRLRSRGVDLSERRVVVWLEPRSAS